MKQYFILLWLCLFVTPSFSQNVGINDDNSFPDASAMLDVQSTTKGILIPRMTTSQRTSISTPASGLLVYDAETESFWFYESSWIELISGSVSELSDEDGDTKIEVEQSTDEDFIRMSTQGIEAITIAANQNITFDLSESLSEFKVENGFNTTQSSLEFNNYDIGFAQGSTTAAWQSFTAIEDWQLDSVVLLYNGTSLSYTITVAILEGEGNSGTQLGTASAILPIQSGFFDVAYSFPAGVSLEAGKTYSIALDNKYRFVANNTDTYAGGRGSYSSDTDYCFELFGYTKTQGIKVDQNGLYIGSYLMPSEDGGANEILSTDGNGVVSWTSDIDNQEIETFSFDGQNITLAIQDDGQANQIIDISSVDNQQIETFSFNVDSSKLTLGIEDDGQSNQSVDLSSLSDDLGNHTATTFIDYENANGNINPGWWLIERDDFDGGIESWDTYNNWTSTTSSSSPSRPTSTGDGLGTILYNDDDNDYVLAKTFGNSTIPAGTHLRIRLTYHFIDSWDGEVAYIAIADNLGDTPSVIWATRWERFNGGSNIFGTGSADASTGVDIIVKNTFTDGNFALIVGSSLDQGISDESFGIDDVEIWISDY